MKRFTLLAVALALAAPATFAATTTYQATGPILEVTDSKIVIEKDKEKWEIARDKDTKVTGDLKKGGRATVHYRMSATSIAATATRKNVLGADDAGFRSESDEATMNATGAISSATIDHGHGVPSRTTSEGMRSLPIRRSLKVTHEP